MFKFIRNLGSPTRWDVDPYLNWLDSNRLLIPDSLADAVCDDRFLLGSNRSFWHSRLSSISLEGRFGRIRFQADNGASEFEFTYEKVLKATIVGNRFAALPSLIVHEIVPLRRRCIRHALTFLGGDGLVIYAEKVGFRDVHLKGTRSE